MGHEMKLPYSLAFPACTTVATAKFRLHQSHVDAHGYRIKISTLGIPPRYLYVW
jgi:hypothetical protein